MNTHEKRAELVRLEAAFDEAGGRGVDLAERIDALRAELGEPRPIDLSDTERLTLADAITAYRHHRTGDEDWHLLPYAERFGPADLDSLRRALLEGVGDDE